MLPRRRSAHDPRLRPAVQPEPLERGLEEQRPLLDATRRRWHRLRGRDSDTQPESETKRVVKEHGDVGKRLHERSRFARFPSSGCWSTPCPTSEPWWCRFGAGLYFQAISALVLVLYGALRSIEKILPIGPLKDGALTRPIDQFVLEWFGDVYVLLRDPAQAASVRGRLIEAIRDLETNDCSPVIVVAHSGGAIVSYMTLADEAQKDLKVDRLITLGEGLNLAWRLTAGDDGVADAETKLRYDRLYSDVFKLRPELRWDDFWASQDPAPVGVLSPEADLFDEESLGKITSHAVWNRLAFGEDHGTYWDNDEEFLIPMARLLDRNPPGRRMFLDTDAGSAALAAAPSPAHVPLDLAPARARGPDGGHRPGLRDRLPVRLRRRRADRGRLGPAARQRPDQRPDPRRSATCTSRRATPGAPWRRPGSGSSWPSSPC